MMQTDPPPPGAAVTFYRASLGHRTFSYVGIAVVVVMFFVVVGSPHTNFVAGLIWGLIDGFCVVVGLVELRPKIAMSSSMLIVTNFIRTHRIPIDSIVEVKSGPASHAASLVVASGERIRMWALWTRPLGSISVATAISLSEQLERQIKSARGEADRLD